MQLEQFYDIATKVSSKKSATTFGNLPDCLACVISTCGQIFVQHKLQYIFN